MELRRSVLAAQQARFINLFEEVLPDSLKVLSKYSVKFQCPVISINQLAREGLAEGTRIDRKIVRWRRFAGSSGTTCRTWSEGFCMFRQRAGKGCPN